MALTVADIRERYKEQSRDWVHERIADLRVLKMQAEGTGDKQSGDILGAMVDELQAWLKQPMDELGPREIAEMDRANNPDSDAESTAIISAAQKTVAQPDDMPSHLIEALFTPEEASAVYFHRQAYIDACVVARHPQPLESPEATEQPVAAIEPPQQPSDMPGPDRAGLEAMHRRDLQKLAVEHGVNGRQKTSMIVEQLVALLKAEVNA